MSNFGLRASPNILKRELQTYALNQKWVSDIFYIPTTESFIYLAVIMTYFLGK
jgi:transposase InsO family protein